MENVDLSGKDRNLDYFNGKIIKYYVLGLKYSVRGIDLLYRLRVSNREYNNIYSSIVLTNNILDYQNNNHIYLEESNVLNHDEIKSNRKKNTVDSSDSNNNLQKLFSEELSRYSFYLGIIKLVRGEHEEALRLFDNSDILNKNKRYNSYQIIT